MRVALMSRERTDDIEQRPRVGVAVIIMNGNKVLLGRRKNAHGAGRWQFPGGHLEFNESVEGCARREALEETGILLKNIRSGPYTNDIFVREGKHYITLFVIAEYDSWVVEVREPGQSAGWGWFAWDDLPRPLFRPIENLLEVNFNPFV
jgi:8-oxo-dGTP diphosphatase